MMGGVAVIRGISKWAGSRSPVIGTVFLLLSGALFPACSQSAAAESLLPPHKKWKLVFQERRNSQGRTSA